VLYFIRSNGCRFERNVQDDRDEHQCSQTYPCDLQYGQCDLECESHGYEQTHMESSHHAHQRLLLNRDERHRGEHLDNGSHHGVRHGDMEYSSRHDNGMNGRQHKHHGDHDDDPDVKYHVLDPTRRNDHDNHGQIHDLCDHNDRCSGEHHHDPSLRDDQSDHSHDPSLRDGHLHGVHSRDPNHRDDLRHGVHSRDPNHRDDLHHDDQSRDPSLRDDLHHDDQSRDPSHHDDRLCGVPCHDPNPHDDQCSHVRVRDHCEDLGSHGQIRDHTHYYDLYNNDQHGDQLDDWRATTHLHYHGHGQDCDPSLREHQVYDVHNHDPSLHDAQCSSVRHDDQLDG